VSVRSFFYLFAPSLFGQLSKYRNFVRALCHIHIDIGSITIIITPTKKSPKSTACSNSRSPLYTVSKMTSDAVLVHPLLMT
jgi:hypothetical protein